MPLSVKTRTYNKPLRRLLARKGPNDGRSANLMNLRRPGNAKQWSPMRGTCVCPAREAGACEQGLQDGATVAK